MHTTNVMILNTNLLKTSSYLATGDYPGTLKDVPLGFSKCGIYQAMRTGLIVPPFFPSHESYIPKIIKKRI
jgi:hypothetical protein